MQVGNLEAAVMPRTYGKDGKRYVGHLMTHKSNEKVNESFKKYD
jgi:hypothetical protein|tara:strand:+ start:1040 stop:1171 length:132 start_codon:yes stop_codon:yes gene_type:complete